MNLRNPLITYLSWFESLDICWADTIASEFFYSFNVLKRTYTLLETSKEEYDKLVEEDYLARESPYYIPNKEDMEAEDWIDGRKSRELQDYLEKFIQLDDSRFVQSIANSLFLATEVILLDFIPLFDFDDIYRKKHIKSLLLGDQEKADEYEEELKESFESRISRKESKESWNKLKKERYNLHTIHDYIVGDIMGD